VLGELQQAPLNEWVRIVSKRADQFCLLATEIFVHLCSLIIKSSLLAFMSRTLARTMMRTTFSLEISGCDGRTLHVPLISVS